MAEINAIIEAWNDREKIKEQEYQKQKIMRKFKHG